MKSLFLSIAITLLSFNAFADLAMDPQGPTAQEVEAAGTAFEKFVFSMKGVNGFSSTTCETGTGKGLLKFFSENPHDLAAAKKQIAATIFVNCLSITTETEEATSNLNSLFPQGSKIGDTNIFISIEYIGKTRAL